MEKALRKILSHFKLVQWYGDPPVTNEEAFRQLAEYLVGNNVMVFPVKPGDTVYTISRGKIKEWEVYFVGINSEGDIKFTIADKDFHNSLELWSSDIGDIVFLTEEDAINELKERTQNATIHRH